MQNFQALSSNKQKIDITDLLLRTLKYLVKEQKFAKIKKDGFFSSYEKIWKIRKVLAKVNNDNALGFNKSLTILTRTRQQRKNYTKRGIFILKILRMKEIIIPDYNHKLKFTQL